MDAGGYTVPHHLQSTRRHQWTWVIIDEEPRVRITTTTPGDRHLSSMAAGSTTQLGLTSTAEDDDQVVMLPQPALLSTETKAFWDNIFTKSMDKFKELYPTVPKRRVKSGTDYKIRDKTTWVDVYTQLQKAREVYDGDKQGLWGRYKKGRRWMVDHSGSIVRQGIKLVPTNDIVSPVLAAVQVLLDVSICFLG